MRIKINSNFCFLMYAKLACSKFQVHVSNFPAQLAILVTWMRIKGKGIKGSQKGVLLWQENKYPVGTTMLRHLVVELTDEQMFWAGLKHFHSDF